MSELERNMHRAVKYLRSQKYKYRYTGKRIKRVNVISPGPEDGWILYKFGESLCAELRELGIEANRTNRFDDSADINHYFTSNQALQADNKTTFMVTHVDTALKLSLVQSGVERGAVAVCMSKDTRDKLISYGVRPDRICYVHPAQDGLMRPRKVRIGFTHRVYPDNRKRETMILDVCRMINPEGFKFQIMGAGWQSIVAEMQAMGFECDYYSDFDRDVYYKLIPNLDYYCYFGTDEGSMGYLDAVAAGIGTIVTPQGYHLDSGFPITYPVWTVNDIVDALNDIDKGRANRERFSNDWSWKNYALKHLEIWNYMLGSLTFDELLATRGLYDDGLYSLLLTDLEFSEFNWSKSEEEKRQV